MLNHTASDLLAKQAAGELTAEAITQNYLDRIKQHDGNIKAFLSVDEAAALAQARTIDAKRKANQMLGALAGIPIAIKDVICIKGSVTTASSKMLRNFVPPYDAQVITKLREADAIFLGKTNC